MKSRAAELERRARRADELAPRSASAEAPLLFAAGLYRAQSKIADQLELAPLSAKIEDDAKYLVEASGAILEHATTKGPAALRELARERQNENFSTQRERLIAFVRGEYDFLSRAIVRPYLEMLAFAPGVTRSTDRAGHCPFCGGAPWISTRRPSPHAEGFGAERALHCARCGTEWVVNRIECPACAEADPQKLPSFQVEQFPSVRIEACETCHAYIKSIDLTLDARPIPEVDDLLSISLDLWAIDQGFERIELGLAGL